MGFRPPVVVHTLSWPDGHPLHGLTVKIESVSVDEYNELMRLMLATKAGGDEMIKDSDDLLDKFAASLRSWDYEHPKTGEALPANRDGVGRADSTHITAIINAWVTALVSVPGPLPSGSPNGSSPAGSQESTLRLADASRSLAS